MMIGSAKHQYTLLSRLETRNRQETTLLLREDGQTCVAFSTGERTLMETLASQLLELSENKAFCDHLESFIFEGKMHLVFKETDWETAKPLGELCKEPLELRLAVMRALFSQLVVQNVPSHLVCALIENDNVFYTSDGNSVLKYRLQLERLCKIGDGQKLWIVLSQLMSRVFFDVEFVPLCTYLQALSELEIQEMDVAFKRFAELSRQMQHLCVAEKKKKETLLEWIRHVMADVLGKGKAVAVYAALVVEFGVVCYLAYSAIVSPQSVDNGIQQIGTVEIYEAGVP